MGEQQNKERAYEDDDFVKIDKLIRENILGAMLKEQHANMLQYQLPAEIRAEKEKPAYKLKLAQVFAIIEENRESHRILDYSLSQTTLDDVFVTFAQSQKDGEPEVPDANTSTADAGHDDRRSEGASDAGSTRRKGGRKREPLKV